MTQKIDQIEYSSSLQKNELIVLYEIGKTVNSTLELDKVLDIIMRETMDLFSADAGSIMLTNPDGCLTIKVARGLSEDIIRKTRVRPGEGIAGWVFQTGEILRLDGKVNDDRFSKVVDRKDDISSSLAVPLKSKGKVIGVLMIRRNTPTNYTDHDQYLISLISGQAALAIENAAQYELQKQKSRELQQLNEDLRMEKMKIEAILSSMADGVIVTDSDGRIVLINKAGCRMLNYTESDVLMKNFDSLFPGQCKFADIFETLYEKKIKRFRTEITKSHHDEEFHFGVLATGMGALDDRHEGVVIVIQNITELKRIDRMKTEFVSMVSHELKTPLTSIGGFAELMLAKEFPKDRRDRYVNIILKDSTRLMRLINNLLDISRLESGQVHFRFEPIKLDELIPDILSSFENQSDKHNIVFNVIDPVPTIMLDRDMFANVLTNLVSNAIKYSPLGGGIIIDTETGNDHVRVAVRDQGMGIPPELQEKIFDKFYRVDSSLTRETGGTGLGLATVKYIIEEFGGKIWVESEIEKGSSFIFTLPLDDSQRG